MQPAKSTLPGLGGTRSPKAPHYRETRRTTGWLAGGLLARYREFKPISSPSDSFATETMLKFSALRFLRHGGIYHSDGVLLHVNPDRGAASRWPGPDQAKERDGWSTFYPSLLMSSGRLFLEGLLASIALLRFTDALRINLLPQRMEEIIIEW